MRITIRPRRAARPSFTQCDAARVARILAALEKRIGLTAAELGRRGRVSTAAFTYEFLADKPAQSASVVSLFCFRSN